MIFFLPAFAVAVIASVVVLLAIVLVASWESTWEDKLKTISRERRRLSGSNRSPREGDHPHQRRRRGSEKRGESAKPSWAMPRST